MNGAKSAVQIVQDVLNDINKAIQSEFEADAEKTLESLKQTYKKKHTALVSKYLNGVRFVMNQNIGRDVIELNVILNETPKEG